MALPQCNPRDRMLELLLHEFQERRVALGITSGGGLLEVVSNAAGTWTIIVTSPKGMACIVSIGEGWRQLPRDPTEPGAPLK